MRNVHLWPPVYLNRLRQSARPTSVALTPINPAILDAMAPLTESDLAHLRDDDITPAVHVHVWQRCIAARVQKYGV